MYKSLDVGVGAAQTRIKAHVNHAGGTGFIEVHAMWRNQAFINFNSDYANQYIFISINETNYYAYFGENQIYFYKPLIQSSDDRLKENEELKESGLIAQEIYHDAPELRHLVHRGKQEFDEEGN